MKVCAKAKVVKWHVAPGDTVNADQIIVDVETDKAIVEIPSPVSGTIVRLGGEPNDVLPIGAVLAVIATGAAAPAPSGQSPEAPAESIEVPQAPAPGSSPPARGAAPASKPVGRALASPATRKLARTLGIDLTQDSRHRVARSDHAGRRGTVRGTWAGAGSGERAGSGAGRRDATGARGPCAGG